MTGVDCTVHAYGLLKFDCRFLDVAFFFKTSLWRWPDKFLWKWYPCQNQFPQKIFIDIIYFWYGKAFPRNIITKIKPLASLTVQENFTLEGVTPSAHSTRNVSFRPTFLAPELAEDFSNIVQHISWPVLFQPRPRKCQCPVRQWRQYGYGWCTLGRRHFGRWIRRFARGIVKNPCMRI